MAEVEGRGVSDVEGGDGMKPSRPSERAMDVLSLHLVGGSKPFGGLEGVTDVDGFNAGGFLGPKSEFSRLEESCGEFGAVDGRTGEQPI